MKTLKKVIALAIVATMILGLCAINVSAADFTGLSVVFKNASGSVITSAKAGATITAEVTLTNGTYKNATVALKPNKDAGIELTTEDMHMTDGISCDPFQVDAFTGSATAIATNSFTIADKPYFTIDITVPATATAGEALKLLEVDEDAGCFVTTDKMYDIPAAAWSIDVADGFTADHATYTGNNAFDFGVDEDYLEEYFADKQVSIFNEEETKHDDFDIDEVTVSPIFEKNIAGTFESAVILTVKKESFTDDKLAASDVDISVSIPIIINQYDLASGYDFKTDAKDLVYTVNAAGGQMDEDALVADFNAKEYTGTITLASKGYSEKVKVVATAASGMLDLTKASDTAKDENVVTLTLSIELPSDTNLTGTASIDPVLAYVKKKNKASSGGSNIGIDTGSTITVIPSENGTVTASAETAVEGTEITIIATPAEGYALDDITVKDSRGADIAVEDGVFIMPARDVKVSATFKKSDEPAPGPVVEDTSFVDVPLTHWAVAYIEALKEAGIVDGVKEADGYYFYPDNAVTRAEFTKMIVSLFDLDVDPSATVQFKDSLNDWYTPYIAAAVEAGYINGISETEFAPNATITRQDAFTILGRAYSGVDASETNTLSYEDAFDVADYAKPYLQILVHLGFVGGDDNNRINPKANITRAESAKIIALAMAYNADALGTKVIADVTGADEEEVEAIKAAIAAGELLYAAIDDAIFAEITGFTKAEVIKALAENDEAVIATFDENLVEFINSLSKKDIEALLAL